MFFLSLETLERLDDIASLAGDVEVMPRRSWVDWRCLAKMWLVADQSRS